MKVFKRLESKDVYTTQYLSKKNWSDTLLQQAPGIVEIYYKDKGDDRYVDSVKHLFFKGGKEEEEGIFYETYPQSSVEERIELPEDDDIVILGIPVRNIGTGIEPTSLIIEGTDKLIDSGEGEVLEDSTGDVVGLVSYSKGLIILDKTKVTLLDDFTDQTPTPITIDWKSNQPLYTTNFHCTIKNNEFNKTQNKSAYNIDTPPYITTIGLYNEAQDLIAVGKLSKPLLKQDTVETTIHLQLEKNFRYPAVDLSTNQYVEDGYIDNYFI